MVVVVEVVLVGAEVVVAVVVLGSHFPSACCT